MCQIAGRSSQAAAYVKYMTAFVYSGELGKYVIGGDPAEMILVIALQGIFCRRRDCDAVSFEFFNDLFFIDRMFLVERHYGDIILRVGHQFLSSRFPK